MVILSMKLSVWIRSACLQFNCIVNFKHKFICHNKNHGELHIGRETSLVSNALLIYEYKKDFHLFDDLQVSYGS